MIAIYLNHYKLKFQGYFLSRTCSFYNVHIFNFNDIFKVNFKHSSQLSERLLTVDHTLYEEIPFKASYNSI